MVNKVVFDYLRDNYGKYNIDDLKKKILNSGYSESDFNECLKILGIENNSSKVEENLGNMGEKPFNQLNIKVDDKPYFEMKPYSKKGIKWMKTGGVSGILFFISIFLITLLISVINNEVIGSIMAIIFLILGIIFLILFIYGFNRVGKAVNSRLVIFSANFSITLIVLLIILIIASIIFGASSILNLLKDFSLDSLKDPLVIFSFLSNPSVTDFIVTVGIIFGALSLWFLAFFVDLICSFIGFIRIGKSTRFLKPVGILGFVNLGIVMGIILLAVISVLFNSPVFISIIAVILSIVFALIGIIMPILMIIGLFWCSKTFESN